MLSLGNTITMVAACDPQATHNSVTHALQVSADLSTSQAAGYYCSSVLILLLSLLFVITIYANHDLDHHMKARCFWQTAFMFSLTVQYP